MDDRLPRNVRRFLNAHIESVEQLETLLLLRERREHGWAATEVSRELRSSPDSIQFRLDALVAHGLLERAGETFAYRLNGARERDVSELAQCYRGRRAAVIETIFAVESRIR